MSTPSQIASTAADSEPAPLPAPTVIPRSVHKCSFRASGDLAHEDMRALAAVHETFARFLANALDAHLGTSVEVKYDTLDQISIEEHIAQIPDLSYVVPFSSNKVIMELDNALVFPIVELLMGGPGDAKSAERDFSEIEDEVVMDVISLAMNEAVTAWNMPGLSLAAGGRIKASILSESFAPNERVAVLRFGIGIGGCTGSFRMVFSKEFLGQFMKQIKLDKPQRKKRVWNFPIPPLRDRMLDCEMELAADLPDLKVAVRDLIALQPGVVLKLRASIRLPGMLTAGGRGLFEAVPVRNGSQRAAQLGRRVPTSSWKKG